MKVFARYNYLFFLFASVSLGQYDLNDTYAFGFNRKPCPSLEEFYSQPVYLTASQRQIGHRRAEAIKLKASPQVNGWEITYVDPIYFGPEQFDRIGEYFSFEEVTWPYVYARSQPMFRPGHYWALSFSKNLGGLPKGSKVVLEVLWPHEVNVRTYTFDLSEYPDAWQKTLYVGLTGLDSPGKKIHPTAWKVKLLLPDESTPVTAQSYLWSF
jgi:hypothetical protein